MNVLLCFIDCKGINEQKSFLKYFRMEKFPLCGVPLVDSSIDGTQHEIADISNAEPKFSSHNIYF